MSPAFSRSLQSLGALFGAILSSFQSIIMRGIDNRPRRVGHDVLGALGRAMLSVLSVNYSLKGPESVQGVFISLLLGVYVPLDSVQRCFRVPRIFLVISSFFGYTYRSGAVGPEILLAVAGFFSNLDLLMSRYPDF